MIVALQASRWLDRAMALLVTAVIAIAVAAPSAAHAAVALVLVVILLCQWRAARVAAGPRARLRLLEWDGRGQWWLHLCGGERTAVRLREGAFVTVPLVVLVFDGGGRRTVVVLLPGSADRRALCRLRAALRTAPGGLSPQSGSSGGA